MAAVARVVAGLEVILALAPAWLVRPLALLGARQVGVATEEVVMGAVEQVQAARVVVLMVVVGMGAGVLVGEAQMKACSAEVGAKVAKEA